jgi:hypothetical protein
VWLLYGIQPHGARHSMTPGRCKGKAHQPKHLGIAGRRVLVSRKWSNKTLDDHRAERGEFVRQLLQQAGIQPAHGPEDGPYRWERPAPADPDVHPGRCCCMPSLNDSDGKPNTPPHDSPRPAYQPIQMFRQLLIKPPERGPRWAR